MHKWCKCSVADNKKTAQSRTKKKLVSFFFYHFHISKSDKKHAVAKLWHVGSSSGQQVAISWCQNRISIGTCVLVFLAQSEKTTFELQLFYDHSRLVKSRIIAYSHSRLVKNDTLMSCLHPALKKWCVHKAALQDSGQTNRLSVYFSVLHLSATVSVFCCIVTVLQCRSQCAHANSEWCTSTANKPLRRCSNLTATKDALETKMTLLKPIVN